MCGMSTHNGMSTEDIWFLKLNDQLTTQFRLALYFVAAVCRNRAGPTVSLSGCGTCAGIATKSRRCVSYLFSD